MRGLAGLLLVVAAVVAAPAATGAEAEVLLLRVALLPQWVVNQHRAPGHGAGPALSPELRTALDAGVVDRVVFWWQRGSIQRSALVWKPVRALGGAEAEGLGGRGEFELRAVRPPAGRSAWTEVDVAPRTARPDDALVLEVGGELSPLTQVLATVLVVPPGQPWVELALAPRALVPAEGVPVLARPFGRPVTAPALFRGAGGAELLVARSLVPTVADGDITPNGPADLAVGPGAGLGDWREGDRVFVRVALATLRAAAPALVLAWKDRTVRAGRDGRPFEWEMP